jgi:hypothetical protein
MTWLTSQLIFLRESFVMLPLPGRIFKEVISLGGNNFRTLHLRVLIDLFLRSRSRPDLKKSILLAFDNIFYGADPDKELRILKNEPFEHHIEESLVVVGHLAQLFKIEQEYSYNKKSNFDPRSLYLQGWLRQFVDAGKEVDDLLVGITSRHPPPAKYVNLENKMNAKKYVSDLKPLWYLEPAAPGSS